MLTTQSIHLFFFQHYPVGIRFETKFLQAPGKEEAVSGWIRSEGDMFLNGAQPCLVTGSGVDCVFKAAELYPEWTMEPPSQTVKEVLRRL